MDGAFCWYKYQKNQTQSGFQSVFICGKSLEDFLSFIHHKEWDGHDDIDG